MPRTKKGGRAHGIATNQTGGGPTPRQLAAIERLCRQLGEPMPRRLGSQETASEEIDRLKRLKASRAPAGGAKPRASWPRGAGFWHFRR